MYKNNEKIVCTIEARMTSSRLPGKVLLPLNGRPALQMMIERIKKSRYVDDVVVATTINAQDDAIVALCEKIGCAYFRGSENDVLSRVLEAGKSRHADILVELTADCPFIDHRHIDDTIALFYSGSYDYASNVLDRSFPVGFDVQVFPWRVLKEVDTLTQDSVDRVHVSLYIYSHPEKYRLVNLKAENELDWPDLAVTLDEKADYDLLSQLANKLDPVNPDFSGVDVVRLLKANPSWLELNKMVKRKDVTEG